MTIKFTKAVLEQFEGTIQPDATLLELINTVQDSVDKGDDYESCLHEGDPWYYAIAIAQVLQFDKETTSKLVKSMDAIFAWYEANNLE